VAAGGAAGDAPARAGAASHRGAVLVEALGMVAHVPEADGLITGPPLVDRSLGHGSPAGPARARHARSGETGNRATLYQ
jgi:hypothetical protein